jgi:group I intron endonuclease
MFGIYCFTNRINNKKYIGQSVNLEERYKSHLRNYNNPNNTSYSGKFYRALRKYGVENFDYEILYSENFLSTETLNELEIYYIKLFDSFNNGYNMNKGGNYTSGHKILWEEDIPKIYELLKNENLTLAEIGKQFDVSEGTIRLINKGKIWISPDIIYPIRINSYTKNKGGSNPNAKMSDEFVMFLRQEYMTKTLPVISSAFPDIPFSSLKKAIYGTQYKHLPIYKKRSKKWFLNDTCIDYPRLEE